MGIDAQGRFWRAAQSSEVRYDIYLMTLTLPLGWRGSRADSASFDKNLNNVEPLIDLTDLQFVTTYGLVGLACTLAHNEKRGFETAVCLPLSVNVRNYLSRMGFQTVLDEYSCSKPSDLPIVRSSNLTDLLLELQTFEDNLSIEKLSNLVWNRLDGRVSPQSLDAIYMGLGEIADNVRYHAGISWGFIAAQTYMTGTPQERITFAIGDIGIGIRKALALYRPNTDLKAIKLALTYDVSGIDEPGRGVGIPTTIEAVTDIQGFVHLRTGVSSVDVFKEKTIENMQTKHLDGTIIGVEVPCRPGG